MNPEPSAADLAALRRELLDHYDEHRRSLPWRGETDPYRILVSEVMLQQTRVETVQGYYEAWMERFPDVDSLAAADEDDVMEAWEGLGYYRRARNLHRAARVVRERPGGSLPTASAELRELPGVGEYTAGAVASIAFGEAVPAVDGNVRRVLARLFDEADPRPAWLRETAAALVDRDRPGDWNQALMDLGATVCTPRGPRCDICPLASRCLAHARGVERERPARAVRRAPREATFAVAVVHGAGQVLLERRPDEGLLGGMWAFPEAELPTAGSDAARDAAVAVARRVAGLEGDGDPVEPLPVCAHRFTHLRATYVPYLVGLGAARGSAAPPGPSRIWVDPADSTGVALPVAQRRILESARDRLNGGGA